VKPAMRPNQWETNRYRLWTWMPAMIAPQVLLA
jgi:hypothetical protein